jgi:hypothetical protein
MQWEAFFSQICEYINRIVTFSIHSPVHYWEISLGEAC